MNKASRSLPLVLVAVVLAALVLTVTVNRPDPRAEQLRRTTLHSAAVFHPELIRNLVQAGANLHGRDEYGHTPLWNAVRLDKPESVRQLLSLGANPDDGGPGGDAPLLVAAFMGPDDIDREIIQLLIQAGADVNAVGRQYHETPLHYAVRAGNRDTVQLLIDSGADIDARSSERDTPLQSAVSMGHVEICELLLAAGADPELRNAVGFRPIDQLNVVLPEIGQRIQAVFRAHGADDQMRHELLAAARDAQ